MASGVVTRLESNPRGTALPGRVGQRSATHHFHAISVGCAALTRPTSWGRFRAETCPPPGIHLEPPQIDHLMVQTRSGIATAGTRTDLRWEFGDRPAMRS